MVHLGRLGHGGKCNRKLHPTEAFVRPWFCADKDRMTGIGSVGRSLSACAFRGHLLGAYEAAMKVDNCSEIGADVCRWP